MAAVDEKVLSILAGLRNLDDSAAVATDTAEGRRDADSTVEGLQRAIDIDG